MSPSLFAEFTDGPWTVSAVVEKVFLTPSSSRKQHLLFCVLRITRAPLKTAFIEGPPAKEIAFVGYITLPTRFHG